MLKGISNNDIAAKVILLDGIIEYNEFYKLNISYTIIGRNIWKIPFILFGICKRYEPDIIHSWDKICTMFSVPSSRLLNIKLIDGTIRYAFPIKIVSKPWILSKINFFFANTIIANSKAGLKTHNLLNKHNAKYIYNGFDLTRLMTLENKSEVKTKYQINSNYIIGMIANFNDAKDYNTYIKAASEILIKYDYDITFLCIGSGVNEKRIIESINPEISQHIKFLGKVEDIESIINIMDVGVLISNTNGHAEGISNSIMEYMALGKPIIATNAGGNKELILDKVSGFLIKPFDINDLIEKLEVLLTDSAKRISMGKAGSERIKKNFNIDKMVNSYTDIYKRLNK